MYPLDSAIGCAIHLILVVYPVDSVELIHPLNNWDQALILGDTEMVYLLFSRYRVIFGVH